MPRSSRGGGEREPVDRRARRPTAQGRVGEPAARIQARLDLAVARGLLLDLLATEERDEVNQAYDHYLQFVDLTAKQSGGAHPPDVRR